MKIMVIGASGYLGSELLYQAKTTGHETVGSYATHPLPGLVRFRLEDKTTWHTITDWKPDIVIWTAWASDKECASFLFLLDKLQDTKFIYISSDIVLCKRTLEANTPLGSYARRKRDEQTAVLAYPRTTVFTVGPIYGETSGGLLDKRTTALISEPNQRQSYWTDVYKTFIPVRRLARTVLKNLDKCGHHFIGPAKRMSYFEFYEARGKDYGLPAEHLQPSKITDVELATHYQCRDLSYGNNAKRLWSSGK